MVAPLPSSPASVPWGRADTLKRAGLLGGCILLAYANTFGVPFLLDDAFNVANNASIRDLRHLGTVLHAVNSTTIAGRPLLNLSFAVNYALGRLDVVGYHWANLAIHGLATATLFGLIRRTIQLARMGARLPPTPFAFLVAALWGLHPIQTESVTYVSERAESLMGLFCLLMLYSFARYAQTSSSRAWAFLSVAACYAGMLTKQAMVTAPLLVLLYDRAFVATGFAALWRERKRYYFAIAASWLLLAALMSFLQVRAGSIGFHTHVSPITYGLTESKVILQYLRLSFWPRSLVFDYGPDYYSARPWSLVGFAVLLLGGAALSVAAWRWSKPVGFLACGFFVLLAPTSSIVPIAYQPMAESRMYLPLAAVLTLAAAGAWWCSARWAQFGLIAAAACCAALSHRRNHVYRNAVWIWEDTVAKNPRTSRGQNVLGLELARAGRREEAVEHLREATRIMPDNGVLYNNLADILLTIKGRHDEGIAAYRQALKATPREPLVHFALANALAQGESHLQEAVDEYVASIRLDPRFAPAHSNLAATLMRLNRRPEAMKEFDAALALDPRLTPARLGRDRLRHDMADSRLAASRPTLLFPRR